MGYVRPGGRSFPGPSAKAAVGIAAPSREHPAKGGAEMPSSSACFRGAFQQRHRAADGGVPSHGDCHASSLCTRWGGGNSSEAKRKRSRRVLTPALGQKILGKTLETRPPHATHLSVRGLARHLGVGRT